MCPTAWRCADPTLNDVKAAPVRSTRCKVQTPTRACLLYKLSKPWSDAAALRLFFWRHAVIFPCKRWNQVSMTVTQQYSYSLNNSLVNCVYVMGLLHGRVRHFISGRRTPCMMPIALGPWRFATTRCMCSGVTRNSGAPRKIIKVGPLLPGPVSLVSEALSLWYLPSHKSVMWKWYRVWCTDRKKRISL